MEGGGAGGRQVRDAYRARFPELESLVQHPVDYARVVGAIGNEGDITAVELEGVLPSATIMVVSVTASTTAGHPLPHPQLDKVRPPPPPPLFLPFPTPSWTRCVPRRHAPP